MKLILKVFVAFTALLPAWAYAQISFQPQSLVVDAQSKSQVHGEVWVANQGPGTKEIWLELEYRWQGPCQADPNSWVAITPTHLLLAPGKRQRVDFVFAKMRPDTKGECHLAFLAREKISGAVVLNIELGMPVFVRLNSGIPGRGEIVRVSKFPMALGKWRAQAEVKNTGEMFLVPFGVAWVETPQKDRIWQTELRLGGMLAPGKSAVLFWDLPLKTLSPGNKLGVQLFWGTLYALEGEIPQSQLVSINAAP